MLILGEKRGQHICAGSIFLGRLSFTSLTLYFFFKRCGLVFSIFGYTDLLVCIFKKKKTTSEKSWTFEILKLTSILFLNLSLEKKNELYRLFGQCVKQHLFWLGNLKHDLAIMSHRLSCFVLCRIKRNVSSQDEKTQQTSIPKHKSNNEESDSQATPYFFPSIRPIQFLC